MLVYEILDVLSVLLWVGEIGVFGEEACHGLSVEGTLFGHGGAVAGEC